MSFRQIDIKHSYVSYGDENIAKAFLIPMLRKTKLYRRSVGFFSSTVFSTIIDGIVSLSRNDGKIQLIASPNLSAEDIHAINVGYQKREDIIAGAFERDFAAAMAELEDAHLQLLKGPIWADTLERLVGTVFKTYWDVYALSISIGMMHDCQIESDDMVPEGYDAEPKSVPRTVLSLRY